MFRPLIGITCRLDIRPEGDWFYLQRDYSEAVFAAGGLPVMVPLIVDPAYASLLMERLDGVVLSGSGSDVDPALYGADRHAKLGPVHQERDATDSALIRLAMEARKPLLGICFGTQALNVALGGTLIQHLETPIPHSDRQSAHRVLVEPDCTLARLGGAGEHTVNTSHHQAIDRVGRGLRVTAHAADGTIEAVETDASRQFLVGVQWHPERIWKQSAISRALFDELVRQAAEHPAARQDAR